MRARYSDEPNRHGLRVGEAMIGDYEACGLSAKEYRGALERLVTKWREVEIVSRTSKGTVVSVVGSRIFADHATNSATFGEQKGEHFSEVNPTSGASATANEGRTEGERGATKKKDKKEKKDNSGTAAAAQDELSLEATPIRPKRRDEVVDALATLNGADPAQITDTAWGAARNAAKQIRDVLPGVTSDEIRRRGRNYRLRHPDWELTANALAKHWADCDRGPEASGSNAAPPREYKFL